MDVRLNRNKKKLLQILVDSTKYNHSTRSPRNKRQLAFGGGFGLGFGAYDYNDYYGDYVSDYSYDYYDWVCSEQICQLCDILTSECCDPDRDVNCFLPDSCLNNPCLSGGTCITSRTIDNRPDFICVCLPGLTGKYCQMVNDYFVGAEFLLPPILPLPPPVLPAQAQSVPTAALAQPAQVSQSTAPIQNGQASPAISQPNQQLNQGQIFQQPLQMSQSSIPNSQRQIFQNQPQKKVPNLNSPKFSQNNYQAYPQNIYLQSNANNYDQYTSQSQNDGRYIPNSLSMRVKTLGAKNIPCDYGKIWNASMGTCVDFALGTNKTISSSK